MQTQRRFLRMFSAFSVLVLAALTMAACGSSAIAAQLNDGKLTICHATGNMTTPYDTVTLDFNGLRAHASHKDDIIPAPAAGCPKAVETGNNVGKLTICHATGSATNPYNSITIDFNGLNGHSNHTGDIIPAPQDGCPSVTPTPVIITVTPTVTGTPPVTTTPTATLSANQDATITICHATGSESNPYVMITVSVNGLNGHGNHSGDIIPAPAGGCPK